MSESELSKRIALAISNTGRAVSWRNNVGVGIAISAKGALFGRIREAVIALVLRMGGKASVVKYGLCVGSSDRIGIVTVTITPEMVGRDVGIFCAWEVKDKSKPSDEQINFINAVRSAGGIAAVVRSPDEAVAAINQLHL